MASLPSKPLNSPPVDIDRAIDNLDRLRTEYALEKAIALPEFKQAVFLAKGIDLIRRVLTDEVMREFMPLQDKGMGFMTDKREKGGYDLATVRECLIEAVLRGARPVFNEFNIIAGRPYLAQAFYARKLQEFSGLAEFKPTFAVPKMQEGGAVVRCRATWKLNGRADDLEAEYAVRVNQYQGADAILGKAKRKFFKAVYDYLTGSSFLGTQEQEFDIDGVIEHQPAEPDAAYIAKSFEVEALIRQKLAASYPTAAGLRAAVAPLLDEHEKLLGDRYEVLLAEYGRRYDQLLTAEGGKEADPLDVTMPQKPAAKPKPAQGGMFPGGEPNALRSGY